jgi:Cu+-exporting ATPase
MEKMHDLLVDPVCGKEVEAEDTAYSVTYNDESFYFCSLDCQLDFEDAPEKYIGDYA